MKLWTPEEGLIDEILRLLTVRHVFFVYIVDRGSNPCRPDRKRTIQSWVPEEEIN